MRTRSLVAAVLVGLIAIGGLAAPGSASAAVEWSDPAGDATGLPQAETSPRPSDPELDILSSSFAAIGENLVASVRLEKAGIALGSFGSVYRWYFKFKDAEYYFMARSATPEYDQLYYSDPAFYRASPDGVTDDEELKCDCKATFDAKANKVTFSIKLDGVKKTLRGGGQLTGLKALTFRRYALFIDGDTSAAPEKTALTL